MTIARPKQTVPVLAYLTSQPLSTLCYMRVFQKDDKQLSFALYVPVSLYRAEEKQLFVLQYDAGNLQNRSPAALDSASAHIPRDRVKEFTRNTQSDTTTLTLNLKQPAPIWCPLNQVIAPQSTTASATAFGELVELAKATVVHLVFDYKWVTGTQQAVIQRLIKGKVRLEGYSLNKHFTKKWEVKDWTHFAPAIAPAIAPADPPEASNKRARPVSGSTSPSPPLKRAFLDDANAPSPTEVASTPPEYAKRDSEADFQTQAIRHVVLRELPAVVAAVLPAALAAALPAVFAAPDPHMNSFDSDASTYPKIELTTAGAAFVPHLLAHLQPQIQDIVNRALSYTRTQRENVELAFEEDVDEKKLELHEITEAGKMELERTVAHNTDAFRHQLREDGDDIAIDVEDQVRRAAYDVMDNVTKRLEDVDRQALGRLVEWELARRLGRSCVRAGSRPRGVKCGKGGCRAVGRRERTSDQPFSAWQGNHGSAVRRLEWLLITGCAHPSA